MADKKVKDEDLLKQIYKLRTHKGLTWENISMAVEEEFGVKLSKDTVKTYYENYVTRASVINNTLRDDKRRAKELGIDWNKKMEEKFELIDSNTNKLMQVLTKILDKALQDGTSQSEKKYITLIPSALAVSRELLNQMSFIKKQQEEIMFNQKNVIYSPLQIMSIINKELEKQIKEGNIKIIDQKTGKVKKNLFE